MTYEIWILIALVLGGLLLVGLAWFIRINNFWPSHSEEEYKREVMK